MRGALFKRLPCAQFLTKSKNFCAHQIEIAWILFWALKFFKKVISQIGTLFAPFLHQSITFSGCHCFHFQCVFFFVISFQTPPRKSVPLGRIFEGGFQEDKHFFSPKIALFGHTLDMYRIQDQDVLCIGEGPNRKRV